MMADLHVNDRRFLQLTKAFSMLGEREREREREVLSNTKKKIKMHQVACQIPSMGTANLYEEAKREGREGGRGGKEDLDSINATLPISNLPISFLPTYLKIILLL